MLERSEQGHKGSTSDTRLEGGCDPCFSCLEVERGRLGPRLVLKVSEAEQKAEGLLAESSDEAPVRRGLW